jgi:hypothetical protein
MQKLQAELYLQPFNVVSMGINCVIAIKQCFYHSLMSSSEQPQFAQYNHSTNLKPPTLMTHNNSLPFVVAESPEQPAKAGDVSLMQILLVIACVIAVILAVLLGVSVQQQSNLDIANGSFHLAANNYRDAYVVTSRNSNNKCFIAYTVTDKQPGVPGNPETVFKQLICTMQYIGQTCTLVSGRIAVGTITATDITITDRWLNGIIGAGTDSITLPRMSLTV